MRSGVILWVAFRNLWSHRLRTLLTVAGVTIGFGAIIFLVSLGYGLEQLVTKQVADFDAFTILDVPSANISNIKIDQNSINKIKGFGHIKEIASVSNLAGKIKQVEDSATTETVVVGAKNNYWKLSQTVPELGKMPSKSNEIAINQAVIRLMGGKNSQTIIGKTLYLDINIPSDLRTNTLDGLKVVKQIPLVVSGYLKDEKSPVVYIYADTLVNNDATKFSALKLKIDNKENIKVVRKLLENAGFSTEYVGDTVSEISQVFSLFRGILAAFGLIALVVAALGTFNTLTISLLERTKEVGLFKALGMCKRDIYKLFLAESLIIGALGGSIGLFLGWLFGAIINMGLGYLANRSGTENISVFATPWFFSLGVGLFSVFVGFLTGLYPSKRAVKINPLDALRYE